ncbi:MAG: TolC family protein [Spirochaetes bacterium]|nr:TolC family protein [Spirochaetota bacterium]
MKKFLLSLFIVTQIFLFSIFSQENIITYDDFTKLLDEKLPELKLNEINLNFSKTQLKRANSLYDVQLNYNIDGIGKKSYSDTSNIKFDYNSGFNTGINFVTTLPSGTSILLGTEYNQLYSWGNIKDANDTTAFNSTLYEPVINIKINQPLLYNFFGLLDRFAKNDANAKLEINILKTKIENQKILNFYKKQFFYLVINKLAIKEINIVIENAIKLELDTKNKMNNRLLDNDDYQKAIYSTLKYKLLLNNYEKEYHNAMTLLDNIINFNNYSPDLQIVENEYKNKKNINVEFVDFYEVIIGKILYLTKNNLEYNKKINFNKLLPKLDVFGNIDIKFHNYSNDANSINNNNSNGDVDFIVGLDLSYFIGNLKARNDYEDAKNLINKTTYEEIIIKNDYYKNLNNIIFLSKKINENITIKEQILDSLISRLKTEKMKFNNAEIELKNILDTENQIITEELELLQLKLSYICIYLDYDLLTE